MPDRRMQALERRRADARRVRSRSLAVRRGWPQFYSGLGIFLVGLGVTVYMYAQASHSGVLIVMYGLVLIGLVQMGRGLTTSSRMKRLEAMQAPLSEEQPWLLAPAAFSADGTVAEPGWLSDPMATGGLRYWDGQNWTAETRSYVVGP